MRIVDSRRVTGSNLLTREPGAIAEVAWEPGEDPATLIHAWKRALTEALPAPELLVREFSGGAALFVAGAVETLLPLTEVNDWAITTASASARGEDGPALDPALLHAIEAARLEGLSDLRAAARARRLPLLVDEEAITVGAGRSQLRFDRNGPLPAPDSIDWADLGRIPIGIVTGTNGKTTTTRLAARMVKEAGKVAGLTSSDGVVIGDVVTHRGDYSGPEGTRIVLRHAEVELAILETARGGILRRGLTVEHPDAAVITNISADHLGDFGVDDVATMGRVKAVAARDAKTVILNAADPTLRALAGTFRGTIVWFARTPEDPEVARVLSAQLHGESWVVRDGKLIRITGAGEVALIDITDIPLAFHGHAAYNVENALAAAALAHTLGVPDAAISTALREFTSSAVDNPGRGNLAEVRGIAVLLDFGHNAVAIQNVIALARGILADTGGGALRITIGMPGDRTPTDIAAIAHELAAGEPALVVVREMAPTLLRGRAPGEMAALITEHLRRTGISEIQQAASEPAALASLLAASRPGDLVLVLVHVDPAVDALLATAAP